MKTQGLLRGASALCILALAMAGGCTDIDAPPTGNAVYTRTLPEEISVRVEETAQPDRPTPCVEDGEDGVPGTPRGTASEDPFDRGLEEVKIVPSKGAPMDHFGGAIAVSGNTLLVGAPDDSTEGPSAGSAYVFVQSGGAWVQQARLSAGDAEAMDKFGFSVAVEGDTAVIGAFLAHDSSGNPGAVYIFKRNGDVWTEQAELVASDGWSLAMFGHSVAISDGVVVVGAMQANAKTGAVYVFEQSGPAWVEKAKLVASDGRFGDALGISVAIDGDTILAGAASARCDAGKYCGAAYVFRRHNSQWLEEAKLVAGDPAAWNFFGRTVSLSGGMAVAGTYLHWNPDGSRGTAYVFERSGDAWLESARLASADAGVGDEFGVSVSASDSRIVVGACESLEDGRRSGAAYLFSKEGSGWAQGRRIVASDGEDGDSFGCWVASSTNTIAVTAHKSDSFGEESGTAYLFQGHGGRLNAPRCDPDAE